MFSVFQVDARIRVHVPFLVQSWETGAYIRKSRMNRGGPWHLIFSDIHESGSISLYPKVIWTLSAKLRLLKDLKQIDASIHGSGSTKVADILQITQFDTSNIKFESCQNAMDVSSMGHGALDIPTMLFGKSDVPNQIYNAISPPKTTSCNTHGPTRSPTPLIVPPQPNHKAQTHQHPKPTSTNPVLPT